MPPRRTPTLAEVEARPAAPDGHRRHKWRWDIEDKNTPDAWISGGQCVTCRIGFYDRTDPYWNDTPCQESG